MKGYLRTANFNKLKLDKTKWYSIDYDKMSELEENMQGNVNPSEGQVDSSDQSQCPVEKTELTPPLPEINTETNTERKNASLPISKIITYLNTKTNSNYKSGSTKTKT